MYCRLFLALSLALPVVASAQVVVYQNNNPNADLFQPVLENEELGDDVTLAGTERNIVLFQVPITSTFAQPYTGTFTARFYTPDLQGLPGIEIWEGVLNVTDGVFGDRTLAFPVSNVTVPDYFIWTLQITDINLPLDDPNDSVGLLLNDVPQIGTSDDFAFDNLHDGTGWSAFDYGTEPIVANYQATITAAVPEPGALTLLGVGAMALIRRRR